jgi:very-short-patch-repair endonuclease
MNPLLAPLSRLDHQVFTTQEALHRGLTPFDLVRLVRAGDIEHLARGIYAFPPAHGEQAEERHLRLAAGVCRVYPDALLTHHSAALALGLRVWGVNLSKVFIARSVRVERIAQHWVIRPRAPWLDTVKGSVGPCASVAATVVQHCLESGSVSGIVTADFALHEGRLTVAELEALAGRVAGWPRSHHVSTMLAHLDGRSESPGESRLRVDLSMAGIVVTPQVTIRDEAGKFVARVDLLVDGTNVVIEFDGLVKYRDRGTEALIAEKRREDELRRLGYLVLRFIWADLADPVRMVRRVREAIAASPRKVDLHTGSKAG